MPFTLPTDTWNDFDKKTNNGIAPYLFENALPVTDGFAGPREVEEAFFALFEDGFRDQTDCRARIYVGEDRRDDLVSDLYSQARKEDQRLVDFMPAYTGAQRFSLVLNNLEQASPRLAADFGLFAQTFFEARGFPIGGTEQAVFCGNYSGTAFGIHEGFEHALLCHLGPGVKNFYCWSREDYLSITDSRAPTFSESAAFDALFEKAELFVLKPGDVLYLPAAVYHIGRQEEYSVSVALPLYTYPYTRFLAKAVLPALADATLPFDEEGMSPYADFQDKSSLEAPVTDLLHAVADDWFTKELPRFTSYYWNRVKSNGGWELPRSLAADLLSDNDLKDPLTLSIGERCRMRSPFIALSQTGLDCPPTHSRVFAAGRSVVIDAEASEVSSVCAQLNSDSGIETATPEALNILQEISRTGGVETI